MARRLSAIMFTDIAGYTPLTRTDEAGALRLLQTQERLVRPLLESYRGRKVKSMGDGLLLEFQNALDAVQCAVELQRRLHERNGQQGAQRFQVRIGIHLGDVQRQGTDILGDAVNIAARLEPLADPGGVCLSTQVFDQVRHRVPYQFEDLGPKSLKGLAEPVGLYRIVLPWAAERPAEKRPNLPRLAVLPLANISPDPKDEYFADGLTEELISVLSQVRGLRVISRTSVNQYKGTTKPLSQIGAELGVDSVLEGSVRKAGDQLRIAVQLIDTRTDEHRWAQTFDRQLENVFAIQAEVAERTAGALQVELLTGEREAIQERPTSSLEAYEAYLRGVQAWRRMTWAGPSRQREPEPVEFLERAIQLDPGFSAAYATLANYLLAVMGITRSLRDVATRARELVTKAIALNPNSSDAHVARGNLAFQADLDWPAAEEEFRQAISLSPSSSSAHFWYGYLLYHLQRFGEAKQHLQAAIDLDPLWLLPQHNLVWLLLLSGERGAAIELGEALWRRYGDDSALRGLLAELYALAGRREDALELAKPLAGATDLSSRGTRASILAMVGQPGELRALLNGWETKQVSEYISLNNVAGAYALLGEDDKALSLLEKDFREGDRCLWVAYQDPVWDGLRAAPRFRALLRAMKLPTTLVRPARTAKEPRTSP